MRGRTRNHDWLWIGTRWSLYARDHFQCIVCPRTDLSIDHIDPLGTNDPRNLVTLCMDCNRRKCNKHFRDWRPDLFDAVLIQAASPLDRALGRALAAEMRPGRLEAAKRRSVVARLARTG